MIEYIGDEEISLKMPSTEIIMEMVRKRLEASGGKDFEPFGKDIVKDIIEKSETLINVS